MTRAELHEILREAKGDQTPGGEPAWWGDCLEDYRRKYGHQRPEDDPGRDSGVDHTFAAYWLSEAAGGWL